MNGEKYSATNIVGAKPSVELHDRLEKMQEQLEFYELILDSIHNGVLVTDADGRVTHFNKPYGRFLGVDPQAQIGKHATEVIENSRMHIVAKTGVPEINETQKIMGQSMVVQRMPIFRDGKLVAVYGQVMFKDVRDVGKLAKKLALLESKVEAYERELISLRSTRYTIESIVGVSDIMVSLKKEAMRAARTDFPVLITGPSGTGKELFAQAIQHASPRRLQPFVRINCAAIPTDLLESELFGYEKGAFTGAKTEGKPGKLQLAHKGAVFLDEIGDLPLEMQPKLLRVLEDKEFERVGGTSPIKSDFRVIAASNQDLEGMVKQGAFRKDLYYRLNVIPIQIPSLRERREDIVPLANHILAAIAQDLGVSAYSLDQTTEAIMMAYDWPGNVRELWNVLLRTTTYLEGQAISPCDLPFYLNENSRARSLSGASSLKDILARTEKQAIQFALAEAGGNKVKAAKALGIHRTLLYKKMKKYGVSQQ